MRSHARWNLASYYCKTCGALDEQGIDGHATSRCKGSVVNVVVNKPVVVVNKSVVRKRTKDRHKNKEARLAYAREYMRRYRATKETKAS